VNCLVPEQSVADCPVCEGFEVVELELLELLTQAVSPVPMAITRTNAPSALSPESLIIDVNTFLRCRLRLSEKVETRPITGNVSRL
jgi:hypothetical protein